MILVVLLAAGLIPVIRRVGDGAEHDANTSLGYAAVLTSLIMIADELARYRRTRRA